MRDFFQNLRISENKQRTDHANSRAISNKLDINALNEKVETLNLMVTASLELLEDLGVSRSKILHKMEEIDLRDGVKDGKLSQSTTCPDCGRKVNSKRSNCFYCGANLSFGK